MMKHSPAPILVLTIIIMILTNCSGRYQLGCRQYDSMARNSTYCRIHREAVWDFVEINDVSHDQAYRTISIERLIEKLNNCNSLACIEAEISVDTVAIGFNSIYQSALLKTKMNSFRTAVSQVEIIKIIICGLENGLKDWLDSLKVEVNHD